MSNVFAFLTDVGMCVCSGLITLAILGAVLQSADASKKLKATKRGEEHEPGTCAVCGEESSYRERVQVVTALHLGKVSEKQRTVGASSFIETEHAYEAPLRQDYHVCPRCQYTPLWYWQPRLWRFGIVAIIFGGLALALRPIVSRSVLLQDLLVQTGSGDPELGYLLLLLMLFTLLMIIVFLIMLALGRAEFDKRHVWSHLQVLAADERKRREQDRTVSVWPMDNFREKTGYSKDIKPLR